MQRSRCSDHDAASSSSSEQWQCSWQWCASSGAATQRFSSSDAGSSDAQASVHSAHSGGSSAACVDLVSGFVRDSIAARNCSSDTNANVRDGLPTDRCTLAKTGQQKQRQALLKIKAEGRVGSLGGMRQEPTRALLVEIRQKPARIFTTASEAISIRWGPVFPSGPLPETYEAFPSEVIDSTFFVWSLAAARWRAEREVFGSAAAP